MQWTNCSKLPTAMYGAYATVINSILYVSGGLCPNYDATMNMFKVYKYELNENQWSVLPNLQQYYGIPVNINDEITVIGGKHSTTKKVTNLVTTYSGKRWYNKYPNLLLARLGPAVVPYRQYVIVAGGESDNDTILDGIEIFDIAKSHWMIVSTCLPEPMYNISATMCDDSFTIVGYTYEGGDRSTNTFMVHVDEIVSQEGESSVDKDSTKWHKLADASHWFTNLVPNTSPPIIIGGSDEQGDTVSDIAVYDDASNKWKRISSLPINCTFTTVEIINQSILVMGGCRYVKSSDTCKATALGDVYVGQLVLCKLI